MKEIEANISKETLEEIDNAREIENLKKVEASLFIAGKFLSTQELVALTDINPILLNNALNDLIDKYGENSAIEIVNKGDLWKMDVKNEHRDIVNKLATGNNEFTKAEQETLAVIAYKQPITQAKIIHIRGNKAYEHVKKFVDTGLVVPKRAGRTYELKLSDEFYDYFSLGKKEKDNREENFFEEEKEEKESEEVNEGGEENI